MQLKTGYLPLFTTLFAIACLPFTINAMSVSVSPTSSNIFVGGSQQLTASVSGGLSPYTYQWLNSSSPIPGATSSTYTVNGGALGTFSYSVTVTDNTTVNVSTSNLASVTVSAQPLSTPTISPSNPGIDTGTSVTFSSTWSGGQSTYTAVLYSSASSTCNSGSTSVQTISGLSSGAATFNPVSPTSSTWYCIIVTDSTSNSAASAISAVTLNNALSAGAITPTSPNIDSGQSITLTSNPTGGTGAYSINWFSGSTPCTGSVLGTSTTYSASPTSTTIYSYNVVDSALTRTTACSSADTVTVNPALAAGAITSTATNINSGGSATLTSHVSGGTNAYTYKWYSISGTSNPNCNNANVISGQTGPTLSVSPPATNSFTYLATDSATTNPYSVCSAAFTIDVNLGSGTSTSKSTSTSTSSISTSLTTSSTSSVSTTTIKSTFGITTVPTSVSSTISTSTTTTIKPPSNTCTMSVKVGEGKGAIAVASVNKTGSNTFDNISSTAINVTAPCGIAVKISASPWDEYSFAGWSCSTTGCYSGTLSNKTIYLTNDFQETANFIQGSSGAAAASGGSGTNSLQQIINDILNFFEHL